MNIHSAWLQSGFFPDDGTRNRILHREKGSLAGFPINSINVVPVPLPHVQGEKDMKWYWWVILIALILLVIIGGAYLRWEFWSGVF
jgi:hypothetical protein